jgi:D-serine deaminase-like pyridoxal phosphate-dependent protein
MNTMDGTHARLTSDPLVRPEPRRAEEETPSLRLAGTQAYDGIAPGDERLGALRNACCLLERLKAEALALEERSAGGRGDPMILATGQSGLDRAVQQLEALIRSLDESVIGEIAEAVEAR